MGRGSTKTARLGLEASAEGLATAAAPYEELRVPTTTLVERAARSRRARPRRRVARVVLGTLAVLLVLAFTAPLFMVWTGTRRARACLARIEAERDAELPSCGGEMHWLVPPAYVPWTSWTARYRAEELYARTSLAAYVDAAVGSPDPQGLVAARATLENAERTVKKGSNRVGLDELGPAIGPPNLGRAADDVGDRATLLARPDAWDDWQVRMHALDAAFLEGDPPRAIEIAKRLAEFDPRDEDLRTAVAATLCLGDAEKRGIEMLAFTQDDRASRRYAAMSRNWGEVRAVIVACAARAGVAPPARPERPDAGRGDAPEARAALRLRLTRADAPNPDDQRDRKEGLALTADLLRASPRSRVGRRALLAALLASEHPFDTARAVAMAKPAEEQGEAPLVTSATVTPADLFEEPPALRPVVAPTTYADGAKRLVKLAADATPTEAATLRVAAGALLLEAGRELALAGDGAAAASAMDTAGLLVLPPGAARALARSTALWVGGDRDRALAELDGADLASASPPAVRAAALVQRAELLASLGRRDDAAAVAVAADESAHRAGDPALEVHARWVRLALADAPRRLREPWPADGPAPAFRWLGFADPRAPWTSGAIEPALLSTLAAWDRALGASAERRRALRYEVLALRGDGPPWPVPLLDLAGRLAAGAGDVETWLDAFYAFDARHLSRRAHAWARAEAARWRGDAKAAERWTKRLDALRAVASDPARAEIARYLGL